MPVVDDFARAQSRADARLTLQDYVVAAQRLRAAELRRWLTVVWRHITNRP